MFSWNDETIWFEEKQLIICKPMKLLTKEKLEWTKLVKITFSQLHMVSFLQKKSTWTCACIPHFLFISFSRLLQQQNKNIWGHYWSKQKIYWFNLHFLDFHFILITQIMADNDIIRLQSCRFHFPQVWATLNTSLTVIITQVLIIHYSVNYKYITYRSQGTLL